MRVLRRLAAASHRSVFFTANICAPSASSYCRTSLRMMVSPSYYDDDDDAGTRWSREIRRSPGAESGPAGMWREAAKNSDLEAPSEAAYRSLPAGSTLITFGKYRNFTYEDVARRDPKYCDGVVRRADGDDMDDEFLAFAKYLQELRVAASSITSEVDADDGECDEIDSPLAEVELEAGRYAGFTYAEVYEEDTLYCNELVDTMMKTGDRGSRLWPLVAYILYRRRLAS
mmetsp:Transcript_8723/g.14179  ORF Transcript_8723/g.14179 Transcript_8723/m.14179 type:complete len:229 (+) Transcript_8723:81-767(+)